MRVKHLCVFAFFVVLSTGCNKATSGTAGYSASEPSAIVGLIEDGVESASTGMETSRSFLAIAAPLSRVDESVCDVHGYPDGLSQSDELYPGYLTYCFMKVNSGDTVLGGFSLAREVSCALEEAGITFDGASHEVTISGTSDCWTSARRRLRSEDEMPATMAATVTASEPASFNENFQKGAIIDLSDSIGLIFKIAANVDGTKVSFITMENWPGDGQTGARAGSMDTATGEMWYEAREERIDCETESSCGWNRHTRIKATLEMENGAPTGLEEISFGYSNIQSPPGQDGYGGTIVTASGDLTDGIKPRVWGATDGAAGQPTGMGDYSVVGNWVEDTNSSCFTSSSETADTCGAGLDIFTTNTAFTLDGTQSDLSTWFTTMDEQDFADVDLDEDLQ